MVATTQPVHPVRDPEQNRVAAGLTLEGLDLLELAYVPFVDWDVEGLRARAAAGSTEQVTGVMTLCIQAVRLLAHTQGLDTVEYLHLSRRVAQAHLAGLDKPTPEEGAEEEAAPAALIGTGQYL